jgi:FAD/FMN-containing dehydrogenase
LRVIHRPEHNGFASFGFAHHADAIAALSEIGRRDLAEEAYIMDPQKTRDALTTSGLASDIKTLFRVVGQETSLLRGLKAGLKLGLSGRRFAQQPLHSLHMTCSARSRRGVQEDLSRAAAIAHRYDGINLPDSIPRAARASLFPPLEGIVGPAGERWVALNAKVAHSDGVALYDRAEAVIQRHADQLQQHGIQVSRLLAVLSNHSFSYEPVLHWKDSWLPMHRQAPQVLQGQLAEPGDNPEARAVAHQVRAELVAVFTEMGAASNQIGRTYPYLSVLHPETGKLLRQLKRTLDPRGLMNPGVLELD